MIPYMVGKLAPNLSPLTRRFVKYVPGRGYFCAVPSQDGDKYVTSPPPPIVERVESCLRGGEKEQIPNTFKEAMSLPKAAYWKEAADKEIQSLEKHGVYELVPMSFVPSSQKVVGTRWVNKIKADGTFKSRLVVQGWSQVPGIDYGGTFAPT